MPLNFNIDSQKNRIKSGVLYIVATPIGNLEDFTIRAAKVLDGVDIIAAEDTRTTGRLLSHYGIETRLVACHEHNEAQKGVEIVGLLKAGQSVALVSDAGTPSVSDPGFRVVKTAISEGIEVVPIPGPSAALTALSVSGLSTDMFVFYGFLPKKQGRRKALIETFPTDKTVIVYESPKRIERTIKELRETLGERQAVLCRELTKLHEEFIRGTFSNILEKIASRGTVKGECTLLIASAESVTTSVSKAFIAEEITRALNSENPKKPSALAKEFAETFSVSRKMVYDEIQRIKETL